ncbi:MAG: response regulator, partial [Lentisphaeraceae bacterium]|nr:response regulator [Lentisphaeraceae bacterium]
AQMEHIEHLSLMGYLSAGLIHDFKNLIGGVQNIIEWCVAESKPQPEVSGALGKTIDYLDQANALMIGLLKLNESKGSESPVDLRLDHLVGDFEMLVSHICSAAINVELNIEEDLPTVKAQPSDMHEILLNLCVNARNAMQERGDKLNISLTCEEKNNIRYVCLSVKDNGCGISKDNLSKIFDAYFSSTGDGTGLGLWMVKEKVSEVNGLIEVESEKGVGSCFKVYIPASSEVESDFTELQARGRNIVESLESTTTACAAGKTILFIEDEPLIHSSISMWLKSLGFNVLAAEDGLVAYDLFCENEDKIDLIIQDYILPGMKGEELLRHFSASASAIPIVVTSAFSGEMNNSAILEKGATAYLPKPFKVNQLIALIDQLIG